MRQAFLAIEHAQAGGQIAPVPGLLHMIVAEPPAELAFKDAPGRVGADLGEGAYLIDEVRSRPDARLDGPFAAALEQDAKTPFDAFDCRLVEFAALQDFEVLAGDVGQSVLARPPALPAAAQEEDAGQDQ